MLVWKDSSIDRSLRDLFNDTSFGVSSMHRRLQHGPRSFLTALYRRSPVRIFFGFCETLGQMNDCTGALYFVCCYMYTSRGNSIEMRQLHALFPIQYELWYPQHFSWFTYPTSLGLKTKAASTTWKKTTVRKENIHTWFHMSFHIRQRWGAQVRWKTVLYCCSRWTLA